MREWEKFLNGPDKVLVDECRRLRREGKARGMGRMIAYLATTLDQMEDSMLDVLREELKAELGPACQHARCPFRSKHPLAP